MQLNYWLLLSVLWTVEAAVNSTTTATANSTTTANANPVTTTNATATTTRSANATSTTIAANVTSTTIAANATTTSTRSSTVSATTTMLTTATITSTVSSALLNFALSTINVPIATTTSAYSRPTPVCDATSYSFSPNILTGVVNQTKYSVSISFNGNTSESKNLAVNSFAGFYLQCGAIAANLTSDRIRSLLLSNSSARVFSSSKNGAPQFTIPSNTTNCALGIMTTCVGTGFVNYMIPAVNMTLPLSATALAAAVNATAALLTDPTASSSSKLTAIANIATGLQTLASSNTTTTAASIQSNSNSMLTQLSTVVGNASAADLASQAAAVISSVSSLISTGSSGSSNAAQAASVLSSVLSSVANSSSAGSFSSSSGNSVASTMATILTAPVSSSNNVSSIVSSLNLLSQIAGSQATLSNPVTYADSAGLVSIMASVSYASNLQSVTNGNTSINVGTAFNSLLSTVATTTVTSRAVSLAVNPYATITADSVNSTRSGVFQFSLFDDSSNPISVSNLSQNFSMTFPMTASMFIAAAPNMTVVPACQYWNTGLNVWSTDGCYYDAVNSNTTTGICLCNHLTAFSVSLASIAPNNLDPVADAANAAHAGLIYLVTGFMFGVWAIAIYYSWYTNRRSVLALNGVVIGDFVAYKASITTDSNPRSSTSARTYLTINGTNGRSECLMFSHGLQAGSTIKKTIIALDVGTIESVTLSHDNTGALVQWKVSEVLVQNVATGNGIVVDTPFIVPQAGIDMIASRVLSGESSFIKRFHSHVLVNIQERHLWVSTVTAPSTSRFSHTERLAICFLLLFGNMGLGFYFHKTRSFTQDFLNIVIVAIITSGIMLVITLPLMYVLRSSQTGVMTFEEDAESQGKPSAQKGPSIRWRYVAWVITLLCSMGALALCALSALELDANNVSSLAAALQSTAISIAESLFISSPLMAVGRSWWNARKNVEMPVPSYSSKKQGRSDANDRVIQATSTMDEQWAPNESIYPSLGRENEPPITTNDLSSAIVPRNKNARASYIQYGV